MTPLGLEIVDSSAGVLLGRAFQVCLVDGSLAWAAEVTVPLDGASTGVFKVVGAIATTSTKLAYRKA